MEVRSLTLLWFLEFLILNHSVTQHHQEAATRGVLCKKVFLEVSQNSQKNACARVSFLIKLQVSRIWTEYGEAECGRLYQKRDPGNRCFPVNFMKVLRTPFFTEHLWSNKNSEDIANSIIELVLSAKSESCDVSISNIVVRKD